MEPWKGRVAGRPREWENVHLLETFPLESDQSLPLKLPKHDLFGRPEVAVSVCIALRDLVHPFSPKVASLELEGGGCKIEDLMVLLRNLPQTSKNALFTNKLAQVAPHEVFVYHFQASH